jgi:hypothetical protein
MFYSKYILRYCVNIFYDKLFLYLKDDSFTLLESTALRMTTGTYLVDTVFRKLIIPPTPGERFWERHNILGKGTKQIE